MANEFDPKFPLEIAEQKIPIKWYEIVQTSEWLLGSFLLYTPLYMLSSSLAIKSGSYSIYPHLISAGLYMLGSLFDIISTTKTLDAADIARKAGVTHTYREIYPPFAHIQTASDLIHNPELYLLSLKGSALALIFPFFGIPQAVGNTVAALNNFRVARRLNLATDLAQSQTN